MRQVAVLALFCLLMASPGFGQVVGNTYIPSFGLSSSVVDPYGNLIVLDVVYSSAPAPLAPTSTTVGPATGTVIVVNTPVRLIPIPKTRVTVIPGGVGLPIVREYAALLQIVGTGRSAVYAIESGYSIVNNQFAAIPRRFIAMDAGAGGNLLPADINGFTSSELTALGDVKLAPTGPGPDTIFDIDPPGNPLLLSPSVTRPAVVRFLRTIKFDGTKFSSLDIPLP